MELEEFPAIGANTETILVLEEESFFLGAYPLMSLGCSFGVLFAAML